MTTQKAENLEIRFSQILSEMAHDDDTSASRMYISCMLNKELRFPSPLSVFPESCTRDRLHVSKLSSFAHKNVSES